MDRNALGAVATALIAAALIGPGVIALAGQPGSIHDATDVYSGPDQKPIKFRAHKGERVDILCLQPDREGLWWCKVGIRGTDGWVVNALTDDLARMPRCDRAA